MPDPFDQLETLAETEEGLEDDAALRSGESAELGLIVLWSADESELVGGWLPVTGETEHVFGRGTARPEDDQPRLVAVQQRPGANRRLPAFQSQALSRVQLLVRRQGSTLQLVNVGRRRLLVNGVEQQRAEARPGDVLELGSQLTLLCGLRPPRLGAAVQGTAHRFGDADAYGIVGESPAAWRLRAEVAFAAARPGHVLVLGQTGTGKELVAQALHAASGRSGPLVSRNAATLPESLVDAELFGNAKGYPNPGMAERKGLIGAADGGSLFLDEFADLPAAAQAHVLRVLDGGEYHRLGEDSARRSQFRLIAATNRPEADLRTDVLARFDFRIRTPDLASRREDIPLLARHLLRGMCDSDAELRQRFFAPDGAPRFGPGVVRRLVCHDYTANVRELRQLLWHMLGSSTGNALDWSNRSDEAPSSAAETSLEREQIQRALDENNGSLEKTWRALGLANRHVLTRLVRKYNLTVTKRPQG